MINLAGRPTEECDIQCTKELEEAKIPLFPFKLLQSGEVKTHVMGFPEKTGWTLKRAWYYWVAKWEPPHKPMDMTTAKRLFETHGKEVRANGDCTCRPPEQWWGENGVPYLYHIDTQEGLSAFMKAISE